MTSRVNPAVSRLLEHYRVGVQPNNTTTASPLVDALTQPASTPLDSSTRPYFNPASYTSNQTNLDPKAITQSLVQLGFSQAEAEALMYQLTLTTEQFLEDVEKVESGDDEDLLSLEDYHKRLLEFKQQEIAAIKRYNEAREEAVNARIDAAHTIAVAIKQSIPSGLFSRNINPDNISQLINVASFKGSVGPLISAVQSVAYDSSIADILGNADISILNLLQVISGLGDTLAATDTDIENSKKPTEEPILVTLSQKEREEQLEALKQQAAGGNPAAAPQLSGLVLALQALTLTNTGPDAPFADNSASGDNSAGESPSSAGSSPASFARAAVSTTPSFSTLG